MITFRKIELSNLVIARKNSSKAIVTPPEVCVIAPWSPVWRSSGSD